MKGKTSIVIAHRLSTVRNAACIYVIEQGRVIESGTHDQLVEADGLYHQLINMQTHDEDKLALLV